ncbi:MAG: hypothetical protein AB1805_08675 [Nitrospirota bacterium]
MKYLLTLVIAGLIILWINYQSLPVRKLRERIGEKKFWLLMLFEVVLLALVLSLFRFAYSLMFRIAIAALAVGISLMVITYLYGKKRKQ